MSTILPKIPAGNTGALYGNNRLYTGREYDKESGLYYNRARYYDPTHGRFLSRDPIGYIDDVNPYRYVGNNPVMFSDPSGMSAKKAIVNGWNYLRYAGSSIIEGGVKGDFVANPNGWNTVGQIGAGFIPIYGQGADIRDTGAAWKNCSGLGGCLGSLSLAGLGYIPGIGDLCKAGARGVKSTGIILDLKQLSKKIKHAPDFGLDSTKPNSTNLEKFKLAIEEHIDSPQSQKIEGTYRGKNVTHYFNEITGNNVIINSKGEFISGWKLNSKLIENLLGRNSLGGF